jgi:predicted FMN-binding regulatory protein PaiB
MIIPSSLNLSVVILIPGEKLWVYISTKDLIEENYYNKKKKILEIIKTWQKRDLTLYGKLTIIKSLIIPQLIYADPSIII